MLPNRANSGGFISSVGDRNNTRKKKKSLKKDPDHQTYVPVELLSFYLKTTYISIRKDSFSHFNGTS